MAKAKAKTFTLDTINDIHKLAHSSFFDWSTVTTEDMYLKVRDLFTKLVEQFGITVDDVKGNTKAFTDLHWSVQADIEATLKNLKSKFKELKISKDKSIAGSSHTEPVAIETNNNTTHMEDNNMGISLRQIAKEMTTLSELMTNRDKVDVEFIIEKYPQGISLNGVDLLTSEGKQYPVFTFAEDETAFFFGGTVLMNIVNGWLKALNTTDISVVSEALAQENVKVVLGTAKTKSGKNVTTVDVIE